MQKLAGSGLLFKETKTKDTEIAPPDDKTRELTHTTAAQKNRDRTKGERIEELQKNIEGADFGIQNC